MNAEHNYCLPYWFEQFSNRVKIKNELCQTDGAVLNPKDKKIPVRSLEDIGLTIHNGNIVVKSKFNYTSEIECKDKFGARRGETCICKAKSVDPCSLDCIFTNDEVKLEETSLNKTQSENKDFFSRDNISNISCTNSYDYEEKIDISETKVDLNGESLVDHQVLNSKFNNEQQLEINLLDPRTGQEDFTVRPVDIMGDIHHLNSDKSLEVIGIHNGNTVVKSEFKLEIECKDEFGTRESSICKAKGIDPCSLDCIFTNDKVKLEETSLNKPQSENTDFFSRDNLSNISCTNSYDYEEKIYISETKVDLSAVSLADHQVLSSKFNSKQRLKMNSLDPRTDGQEDFTIPLVDTHYLNSDKRFNRNGDLITTNLTETAGARSSKITKFKRNNNHGHKDNNSSIKNISGKIFHCLECNKQFTRKANFDEHLLSKHKDNNNLLKMISSKIYQCLECNKQYIKKSHFDLHILNYHKNNDNLLKTISSKISDCLECNKQFIDKSTLDKHIFSKHQDNKKLLKMISMKIHDCRQCNKQFINKSHFHKHILNNHKDNTNLLKMISSKMYNHTIALNAINSFVGNLI